MMAVVTLGTLMSICSAGDAFARAGHFEIHVAVMVFGAGDVGQDGVLVALLHQAHGHAAHVRAPAARRRPSAPGDAPQTVAMRARSVGFQNVAHHAHGVGKHRLVGNQRQKRPLRQRAVADFAAARARA